MKTRISAFLLATALAVALTGCGTEAPSNAETPPAQQDEVQPTETAPTNVFESFAAALDNAGYDYEVIPMAAELVGAERGEKYKFSFGSVELYRFADRSEELSAGEVELEGFGAFPIEVNGNYGLLVSLEENEAEIIALFEAQ